MKFILNNVRGKRIKLENKELCSEWGGVCILLTEDGCPLSFEERPKGARLLIPSANKCKSLYTKEDCCIDWIKYHDILEDLHDYYLDKED